MTVFVNRSIPLSEESRNGWTNAGAVVLSRRRVRRNRQFNVREQRIVVNLGLPEEDIDVCDVLFNSRDSVTSVLTPAALRRTMPDLIPPWPSVGDDYWVKRPGYGGRGKQFFTNWPGTLHEVHDNSDRQKHVEGTEYRVITVGNIVVQAHKKTGTMPDFEWTWVGVQGVKNNGIIPLVKRAVSLVPNGEHTIFGWDVIVGLEGPVILEANSSPGVNDPTARRIVDQIRKVNGT